MNFSDPCTLHTPAGDIEFNPAGGGDGFYLTVDTTGLDQAPIRANNEDAPQTDGSLVHNAFKAGRQPLIVAQYLISTGTIADRDEAFDDLEEALDSILQADGTWTQHRAVGDRVLTVRSEIGLSSTGGPQLKQATFGLIAANPVWA